MTREMVTRQARLMTASARVLARDPALGRELPRLLRTGGRSTMRLGLPWLPFRLIDELEQRVDGTSRVFEYGGGGSTLWFLDRGATVVTVEHHPGWAAELRRRVSSPRWTLVERPPDDDFAAYVAAIEEYPDDAFDVVVVDGRERARCLTAAMPKVRPGGLLIVDDVDRARYRPAIESTGWPVREVVGFAPAKPSLAYTAVLTRPER